MIYICCATLLENSFLNQWYIGSLISFIGLEAQSKVTIIDKIKKIKTLVKYLNRCRDAYYNQNAPFISDKEYDELFDQLEILEKEAGFILGNSPTQSVGYAVKSKLEKVAHPIPLLSLAKTKDVVALEIFAKEQPCLLMCKFDGLTVELVYEDGKLVQASTRGNGVIGEDITHNALTFINVPKQIKYKNHLRIVGEAIITKDNFVEINENLPKSEKQYANPRNLVSGSVRQLDSSICAKRNVHWFLWDVLEGLDDTCANSRNDKINYLGSQGFDYFDFAKIEPPFDEAHVHYMISFLKEKAKEMQIPIDGIVIKYDDIDYAKKVGGTSHHNKDGLAFKFEDETAITYLKDIKWSVGRTGQLTPVAVFKPVELEGTIISKASLHNVSVMQELLGEHPYYNQEMMVYKANMIIPQVLSAKKKISLFDTKVSNGFELPTTCPLCNSSLEMKIVNDTKTIYCGSHNCLGKKIEAFSHFVSKEAMNIDGLSEATIEKFLVKGWLTNFPSLYHLDRFAEEIIQSGGFGEKSYEKLWQAIQASQTTTLDRLLVAMGIPGIGKTACKSVANYCQGDANEFLKLIRNNFDWSILTDFGRVMSDSIRDFFNKQKNLDVFIELLSYLKIQQQQSRQNDNFLLAGKTIVVTGSLENFTRDSIHQKLEELGAKVSGSVSKKTDCVIVGNNPGSKYHKVIELNIPILTEKEFLEFIKE